MEQLARTQSCVDMARDIAGLCRICAQKNDDLVSVFDEQGRCRKLFIKLQICLQIIVMKHVHLPTTICLRCLRKLEVCYELMQLRIIGQNEFHRQQQQQERLAADKLHSTSEAKGTKRTMDTANESKEVTIVDTEMEEQRDMKNPRTMWTQCATDAQDTRFNPVQQVQSCKCDKCVNKYGGLPLLAEVVERSSRLQSTSVSGPSSVVSSDECESRTHMGVSDQHTKSEIVAGHSRGVKKETSCEYCGKSFNHTGDLNKHRRSHTGEKPYACSECNKRFSHASNLLRHRKIHSGERPFSCPSCGKGFSRKDKMLSHIRTAICARRSESQAMALRSSPQSS